MSYLKSRQHGTKGTELVANLTALDLCDAACPAGAATVVVMPSQFQLLLCGHHTRKNEVSLLTQGAVLYTKETV